MNTPNPYAVTQTSYHPSSPDGPRRISIGPIEALSRGYQLLGDQYWLFMGVSFVGLLIATLVPLYVLMGPMLVGIFFCVIEREQGRKFDFNTLFRGFDRFADSLIATIVMVVTNLMLIIPLVIVFMVVLFSSLDSRGQPHLGIFFGSLSVYFVLLILFSVVGYLPYSFCYQLIADKKLAAFDAIKLSARGVWHNLGPMIAFSLVGSMISFALTLFCYIPVFFFLPIWFSAAFVVYRQVFPESVVDAQVTS
jgi:uncharacterized membrane protein